MKLKKKVLSILLAVSMVMSMFGTTALAAETSNVSLEVDKTTVQVGDTVTVTVKSNAMTISSFAAGIFFDKDKLTCTSIAGPIDGYPDMLGLTKAGLPANIAWAGATATPTVSGSNETGTVGMAVAGTDNVAYVAGTIFTITFEVKAAGTAAFTLYEDSAGTDGFKSDSIETKNVTIAAAEETSNVNFEVDKTTVQVGDTVTVTVKSNAMTISSFAAGIFFDKDKLTCTSIAGPIDGYPDMLGLTKAGLPANIAWAGATATPTVSGSNETGTVGMAVAGTDNVAYVAGTIFTITFEAKAAGTAAFTLYEDSAGTDGFKSDSIETKNVDITAAPHTCTGTLTSGQDATCTVDGWNDYYTCSCGKYYSDSACTDEITNLDAWKAGAGSIPAAHGETTAHGAVGSTCKTQGNDAYSTCNVCGAVVSGSDAKLALDPNNHEGNLTEVVHVDYLVTPATCESKAVYNKIYDCCGAESSETFQAGELAAHDYGTLIGAQPEIHDTDTLEAAVAAHYQCSVCEKYFDESFAETTLAALTGTTPVHSFGDWVKTDASKHWKACACGLKSEENFHIYDSVEDMVCDTCGYDRSCQHGGATTVHSAIASTCKTQGNAEYTTCDLCEAVIAGSDAKLPLNPANHEGETTTHPAVASTCKVQGNGEYVTCNSCNGIISGSDEKLALDANNHVNTTDHAAVVSTCKTQGNEAYTTCDDCGAVTSGSDAKLPLNSANHEGETTTHPAVASTCKVQGNGEYVTCNSCSGIISGSDEKLALNPDNHEGGTTTHSAVASTCKTQGNGEYATCNSCDVVVSGNDAKLALNPDNHEGNLINTATDEYKKSGATCKAKAVYNKHYDCCGTISEETFESGEFAEHNYGEKVAEVPATHTTTTLAPGMKAHYFCDVCDTYFTAEKVATTESELVIPAPSHSFGDWVNTDPANHWKACSCGLKTEEDAHSWDEATCLAPKTCSVCKATVGEVADHTAGTEWKKDKNNHWHICTVEGCGAVIETSKAAHDYGTDNVCDTCEYKKSSSSGGGGGGSVATYAIVVEDSDNGEISASKKSASKGTDITLTVKADEGYELDTLKVLDKNGDKVKVTKKGDKYTFEMPASKVTVKATFSKIDVEPTFDDVAEDAYYFDAVEWAVEEGITSGTSATTFSPNASCTRAQAVTFLWRAAGSPEPESTEMPFEDVADGAYYYDAVLWAVENGITAGTSATTFAPNATCTRAQIVTFLWRSQKSPAGETVNPFTDVAAEAYYYDAVLWAVENGVTAGTTATTFSPNNNCTRAQIVTFLYRALNK